LQTKPGTARDRRAAPGEGLLKAQAGHRAGRHGPGSTRASRLLPIAGLVFLAAAFAGGLVWRAHRTASGVTSAEPQRAVDPQEALLRASVARAPADADAHQALGAFLAERGQAAEAIWELAAARELGRSDAVTALQLAGALRLAGLPAPALTLLEEERKSHQGDTSLGLALADTLMSVGRAPEAVALLASDAALADTPEGLLALGRARYGAGDAAGARTALLRCRALGERMVECDQFLGRMALADGNLNEARARLEVVARARPQDAGAQYDAGLACGPDREDALRFFAAALRLDPRHARAGYAMSRLLHEQQGHWMAAARAYGQALALEPNLTEAEQGLARVLAPLGMPAEVAYHQARYYRLKRRPDRAVPLYRRWGELRPERWESVLRVGECLTEMQRQVEAARAVEAGLKRFPTNVALHRQLAQLDLATVAPEEATRVTERWAQLDPASGEPEWMRGRIAQKARKNDEALRWFEAALHKHPDQPIFQLAMAQALAESPSPDRLQRAASLLAAAETADPGTPEYAYQHGVVLQALNDPEGARRAFLRVLANDPRRVELYNALVQCADRLGRPGVAAFFASLERSMRQQARAEQLAMRNLWARPADPSARWAVARALLDRGDLAGAADHLEVAATSPDLPEARAALQRVRALRALDGDR
jgi:tetratricopeptide (TPR) repeat protein